jgi:DNA-binding transcriptional MerR regulator
LRYWEQEFTQLRPMKRRGNRRYYQHHEVLLIRRIRELLYDQGFTISGARNRLAESMASRRSSAAGPATEVLEDPVDDASADSDSPAVNLQAAGASAAGISNADESLQWLAQELSAIRRLLED